MKFKIHDNPGISVLIHNAAEEMNPKKFKYLKITIGKIMETIVSSLTDPP